MCEQSYKSTGSRSYGDNIPTYAQGRYFPGDEPGKRCRLTDEPCGNPDGTTPEDCAANSRTEWLCPSCQTEETDANLWWQGESKKFFCRECGGTWTEKELPKAFTDLVILLVNQIDEADSTNNLLRTQNAKLHGIVCQVRAACDPANQETMFVS